MISEKSNQNKQDRFPPYLVTQLLDDAPQDWSESGGQQSVGSLLKTAIQKNLEMILNSSFQQPPEQSNLAEIVRNSVLFFGLPNFSGRYRSSDAVENLRKEVIHQIRCFEPRIDSNSLEVDLVENPECPEEFCLRISGTIAFSAVNETVYYERKISWNTGNLSVLPQHSEGGNHA